MDQKLQGRSELHGRADSKRLKGASGGKAERMAGFIKVCRRGRLGMDKGSVMDMTGGDDELGLDRTSGDEDIGD